MPRNAALRVKMNSQDDNATAEVDSPDNSAPENVSEPTILSELLPSQGFNPFATGADTALARHAWPDDQALEAAAVEREEAGRDTSAQSKDGQAEEVNEEKKAATGNPSSSSSHEVSQVRYLMKSLRFL